ncbi:MAG: ABC transporter substrate-binding protein [Cyanobacteria bacterium SID2]|nr:ABC transporter substrate-binding protein [Cyanobacteria bacterium SID2]MBP0006262.1 ABC transporter substrate-binding protein [Cyanobacteria bacterium SBC]
MQRRNFFVSLGLFFASLLITVSCTQSPPLDESPTTATSGDEAKPVVMGFSAWPGWFPWQVAQEAGIFEASGATVDLRWFDGYLDSLNALVAEQLDANTQTLNDTISSVAVGSDQVIVLVNDNSTGNDKIIVSDEINSIEDLKGKTIAVEEGTVDHFLLLLGLEKAEISPDEVTVQPLETGAAAAAFVAGQVDAVGVFAPFTTKALEREGSKELFSSADFPGAIPDHLVVSRQLIEERPEQVQALVDSWFATLQFIEENQDEAYEMMAKRAGVSIEEYKEYDAGTTIFSLEDNLKAFQPGEDMTALPYAAEKISDFLLENELIQEKPDLSQLFDDRFVKAYSESQGSAS